MSKTKILLSFILFVLFLGFTNPEKASIESKVDELLKKMTLTEKIGQMNQYNGFWDVTGPVPKNGNAALKYKNLASGKVGSMLNIHDVKLVREIQKIAVEESRLGIPLIFGYDVIHGYKTQAPIPLAEAASWDLEAIQRSASVAAAEAASAGINWTFAPNVDVGRDPRWGRVMEGAGEDPYLGSKIAYARVKGFQGEDLSAPNTIAACAKHFAGYGFAIAGKEYNSVDMSGNELHNTVMPPFKAAINAGVKTFMNSFNELNGIPSNAHQYILRDLLKGSWEFNGFVISDWGSIAEMVVHGYVKDIKASAQEAVEAGCDMDMESSAYIMFLEELVKNGEVPEKLIDDAVRRILTVKYELGLFDDPYKYCDQSRQDETLYHVEHLEAVRDMAKKSIVLLKNEKNLLPLPKKGKKIAVIGPLGDDKNSPLGSWRLASDDSTAVSVLEGLSRYTGNEYTFSQGVRLENDETIFVEEIDLNTTDLTGIDEAVAAAKAADYVVLAIGEHGYMSGEARSRTNIDIPGLQKELMKRVYAANPNTILVLMNGRPLTIPWAADYLPAIVEAWQLGSESGNAIAEVLMGDYNPSGKLPMTFPRSLGQIPIYYNHKRTGRPSGQPNNKDFVFWSHYMDSPNTPLFPFGYGLSYTTFKYGKPIVKSTPNGAQVSISVSNTGVIDGEEIIQLYIHDKVASITRPIKELKGFEKVMIAAGKSVDVTFDLGYEELGFYNNEGEYLVEPGDFDIMVGGNSVDLQKVPFALRTSLIKP